MWKTENTFIAIYCFVVLQREFTMNKTCSFDTNLHLYRFEQTHICSSTFITFCTPRIHMHLKLTSTISIHYCRLIHDAAASSFTVEITMKFNEYDSNSGKLLLEFRKGSQYMHAECKSWMNEILVVALDVSILSLRGMLRVGSKTLLVGTGLSQLANIIPGIRCT